MCSARFLANESLWSELQSRIRKAKRVRAAIAYFGTGAAKLLPLGKGDELVVDMSLGAVKQGQTNPHDIGTLMRREVTIFSRPNLHAKFIIADRTVIAGSANASNRSLKQLDEAGLMTSDAAAVKRAEVFFEHLSVGSPVGPEYLKRCKAAYRHPRVGGKKGKKGTSHRASDATLWIIGGLHPYAPPADEAEDIASEEAAAKADMNEPSKHSLESLYYTKKPSHYDRMALGAWAVECYRDESGKRWVYPPYRLVRKASYPIKRGQRYLLIFERPSRQEEMSLAQFRKRIRKVCPGLDTDVPRTRPINDGSQADAVLRLWTRAGRISNRKR